MTPARVGPRQRGPAQAEDRAEHRCTPQAVLGTVAQPDVALQGGDEAEEGQAHGDGDHAADALQEWFVGQQRIRHAEHGEHGRAEHDGEAKHEQQSRAGDPPAVTAARGRFGLVHRRCLGADQSGQVGQVAGNEGDDAG